MKLPTYPLLLVLSHCVFGDTVVEKNSDGDKSIKKKADIHLVVSAGDSRQAKVVTIPIDGLSHSSRNQKTFVYPPTRVDLYSKSSQNGGDSSKSRRAEEPAESIVHHHRDPDQIKPTYHEPAPRPSSTDLFREQANFEKSVGGTLLKESPSRQKQKSIYYERPYFYSNELPVPKIVREKQGSFGGRASWKPMRQSRKRIETKPGEHQHEETEHGHHHPEERQRKVADENPQGSFRGESGTQNLNYPKYYEVSHRPEVVEENHEGTGYRVVHLPSQRVRSEYGQANFEAQHRPLVEPEAKPTRYVEREPEPRRVVQSYHSEPNFRIIRVPVPVDYEGSRSVVVPNYENAYNKAEPPRFKHQYLHFDEQATDQRPKLPRHHGQHFETVRHYEEPRHMQQERYIRNQPIEIHRGRQRGFYGQPNRYELYPRPVRQYVNVEESRQVVFPFYQHAPTVSRPRPNADMDIIQFERRPEEEMDVSDSIARPTFAVPPPNGIPRPGPLPQPPPRPVRLPGPVSQRPLPARPGQLPPPFTSPLQSGTNPQIGRNGYKVVYLPYNVFQNVLQGNSAIDVLRLK